MTKIGLASAGVEVIGWALLAVALAAPFTNGGWMLLFAVPLGLLCIAIGTAISHHRDHAARVEEHLGILPGHRADPSTGPVGGP